MPHSKLERRRSNPVGEEEEVGGTEEMRQGEKDQQSLKKQRRALQAAPSAKCGPNCASRMKQLQRMGGCDTLDFMCTNLTYSKLGPGLCTTGDDGQIPPMYLSLGKSLQECQNVCDDLLLYGVPSCTGVTYNPASKKCLVITMPNP